MGIQEESSRNLLRFCWDSAQILLGFCWDSAGILLGFCGDSAEILLGFCWDSARILLGFCCRRVIWGSSGCHLGSSWGHLEASGVIWGSLGPSGLSEPKSDKNHCVFMYLVPKGAFCMRVVNLGSDLTVFLQSPRTSAALRRHSDLIRVCVPCACLLNLN